MDHMDDGPCWQSAAAFSAWTVDREPDGGRPRGVLACAHLGGSSARPSGPERSRAWRSRARARARAFWRGVRSATGPLGFSALPHDAGISAREPPPREPPATPSPSEESLWLPTRTPSWSAEDEDELDLDIDYSGSLHHVGSPDTTYALQDVIQPVLALVDRPPLLLVDGVLMLTDGEAEEAERELQPEEVDALEGIDLERGRIRHDQHLAVRRWVAVALSKKKEVAGFLERRGLRRGIEQGWRGPHYARDTHTGTGGDRALRSGPATSRRECPPGHYFPPLVSGGNLLGVTVLPAE